MKTFAQRFFIAALTGQVLLASTAAQAVDFRDTTRHWANPSIDKLSDADLLSGYPDGSFKPESTITRAEFAAILSKALNLNANASGSNDFYDVPQSHWAAPAIGAVKANNVISGYPGGRFAPSQNISRTEALVTLASAADLPKPSQQEIDYYLSLYNDENKVPDWAKASVAAAIKAGIYQPQPNLQNNLNPQASASRADVAYMTDHYLLATNHVNLASVNEEQKQQLSGYVWTVPRDTKFKAMVQNTLNSEELNEGDEIQLLLPEGLPNPGSSDSLIPPGTKLVGEVREISKSGFTGKNASLDIDFDALLLPSGKRIPLQAKIATENGELSSGSTAGRLGKAAGKTAIGAAAGALLGTALGPLSGGEVGKGAIYGTAIGAGAGAVTAAASKGKALVLQPGELLEVELEKPLTLQAEASVRG